MQLSDLTAEHFDPCIGQAFVIHYEPDQMLDTKLIRVTRLGPEALADKPSTHRRAFSLTFQGPMTPILGQSIYAIDHASLGTLNIFIVPTGPDSNQQGMCYEAIFT
jgi:hypothetical protein